MVISKNSQLALMLWDNEIMVEYLHDLKKAITKEKETIGEVIKEVELNLEKKEDEYTFSNTTEGMKAWVEISDRLGLKKENKGFEFYTKAHPNPYYYLIMPSVHACAEMIKVKEHFSCSVFNKVKDGEHVYLLGKTEFFRFVKFNGAIRGLYWNRAKREAFEIGLLLVNDQYYFPGEFTEGFSRMVKLMTFIELGDTEVVILEKGRNNGKSKSEGKIANMTENTVYVVDSSWNKIIIRTDGFGVRGHFRLQPCGANMTDRKLIWIDAFEKHGYTRQPKARILHEN